MPDWVRGYVRLSLAGSGVMGNNAYFAFLLGVGLSGTITLLAVEEVIMREALDRGYAVQCVGKSGIYWECE